MDQLEQEHSRISNNNNISLRNDFYLWVMLHSKKSTIRRESTYLSFRRIQIFSFFGCKVLPVTRMMRIVLNSINLWVPSTPTNQSKDYNSKQSINLLISWCQSRYRNVSMISINIKLSSLMMYSIRSSWNQFLLMKTILMKYYCTFVVYRP